jgi:sulfotransferase family protein
VIHALRDPRDCCLSAYFQNFGPNVLYSRDLGLLGTQYVHHREMMDYWTAQLEIPVYTSVYEEFVGDQERHTRELLEFIGIEFDEACMRFHEDAGHVHTASSMQVRQPVYQSSRQRWKNYEKHLGPLLEALGPYADGVMAGGHEKSHTDGSR